MDWNEYGTELEEAWRELEWLRGEESEDAEDDIS